MQSQFTDKAQNALSHAARLARSLKQGYIGTEHILLGLIKEGTGVAARVLTDNGVQEEQVLNMLKELIAFENGVQLKEREGYSPRAKRILEEAHRQAERFGHHLTGTEHILLALIKEGENVAVRLLNTVGANIQKELESGVTTMRIMGEEHHIDVDIRRGIEEGLIVGPRLNISGHGIVASNGHGVGITTSDGEVEVRKNIRSNFAAGTDFVKMFMTGGMSSTRPPVDFCGFSREEVRAAVEEANRMRTYVAAHAHGGPGVDMCIEEGVRSIEHGALMTDEQIVEMVDRFGEDLHNGRAFAEFAETHFVDLVKPDMEVRHNLLPCI